MLSTVMTTENWPWHPDLTVATALYFHGNDMERTYQMVTDTVLAQEVRTGHQNKTIFLKRKAQHYIQQTEPQLTWSGADQGCTFSRRMDQIVYGSKTQNSWRCFII